jgi:hypothetical protein
MIECDFTRNRMQTQRIKGHVPTCVDMSHSPNELFVPNQRGKNWISVAYCWRNK